MKAPAIKQLREDLELNHKEFSVRLGVRIEQPILWERNIAPPNPEQVQRLRELKNEALLDELIDTLDCIRRK